jgi:integrase/recombinase XerC
MAETVALAHEVLGDDLQRFLQHLRVERRLAARTLAMYHDALVRLQRLAAADGVDLRRAQVHHVRGWVAALRGLGLAPRSMAIALAAWRGLYALVGPRRPGEQQPRRCGACPARDQAAAVGPGAVDQAVALAELEPGHGRPELLARDHAIVELLYGCGLRIGELLGLDVAAGPGAAGWVDGPDATAHVLGKGSKRRSVPVGGPALQALQAWLRARPDAGCAGRAGACSSASAARGSPPTSCATG